MSKLTPREVVGVWLLQHDCAPATADADLIGYEVDNSPLTLLLNAWKEVAWVAGLLMAGKIGRRAAVDTLQRLHLTLSAADSEIYPGAPTQPKARREWCGIVGPWTWRPWTPFQRFGKGKRVAK
jgi:hypothetical protein